MKISVRLYGTNAQKIQGCSFFKYGRSDWVREEWVQLKEAKIIRKTWIETEVIKKRMIMLNEQNSSI